MSGQENNLFAISSAVQSDRILYTPSGFARTNLLYLQEVGRLTALSAHTSRREKLLSCLCFVVIEGSGLLIYNGYSYNLKAGDVVFIDCNKPYAHRADAENLWSLQWCHFYGTNANAIYTKYCERGGEPVIHPDRIKPYTELLTELYNIAASDDHISDMRVNEKLGILLTYLMEESWHPEKRHKNRAKKQDVKPIKLYIDENYNMKITLESIAEKFFVNKHYLARLFKAQYGVTITGYIQQVRITHAKILLRFTDKKIEEIGFECGFGELTYFSRVFKKIEGVNPREYRNLW